MGAGERRDTLQGDDNGNSNFHRLRIIALRGVRDVECDCIDGAHAEHSRVTQYAFLDSSANVVIKKSKTLLLPLNY
ncbi:hypothetical protein DFH06DRAFT_1338046 [Mycena polygramma]|nr:hypothetical protein DFH06DRAFT_1338046 [Mycena polygramma]